MFLNQVIASAVENNPELQTQRAQLGISRSEALAQTGVLNPFFTFSSLPNFQLYEFGLQKAIETGRPGRFRKRLAQQRIELEEAELELQILELKNKVTEAYTNTYINQEKIKIFDESYNIIRQKVDEQELSELEMLLIEEEMINILQQVEDAKIEVEKAELVLENLVGERVTEGATLETPRKMEIKEELNLDNLLSKALKKRPEIIINDKEQEIALSQNKLAKSNLYPLAIIEPGAVIDFEPEHTISTFAIAIDLELPVMGIEKKEIQASETRIEEVAKNRKNIEKDIRIEVTDTLNVFKFAKKRLEEYEEVYLLKTEDLISAIREKYKNNEITFTDLLKAEKARLSIYNNYFDSLYDFEYALSDLERAVGFSLIAENPQQNPQFQHIPYNFHTQMGLPLKQYHHDMISPF